MVDNQFYCGDCGTVDLGIASIEEWEELYRKKYGKKFIEKKEPQQLIIIYNIISNGKEE